MIAVKEAPKMDIQELLARAQKPSADAMKLHPFYRGKIETVPKACIRSLDDFAIWYTPGVAAPCRAIEENPELVYEHTNKWNTVAIVSDGTRVLGLGDIGPKAGLPVMEGKALLFKYLGGVDAVPIMLDTKDPDEIIHTVSAAPAGFRRHQPGGYLAAEVLPHPGYLAREGRNPDLARRSAGHRLRHAGRAAQRAEDRGQAHRRGQDRLHRVGRVECGDQPAVLQGRRRPGQVHGGGQPGHPARQAAGHLLAPRRVRGQVAAVPDDQRRGSSGRHRRGAGRRGCLHRAQQAGAGHDPAGVGAAHGRGCHRLRLRQPDAGDLAVGGRRLPARGSWPRADPTSRTR